MFKTYNYYHVNATDFLSKAFTNKELPSGYIDKGRCAIGGTQMELENKFRCSIITVSHVNIILCKIATNKNIDPVHGDITKEQVYNYLENKKLGQKIMTTPEGMWKIMWAAKELGREQEILNEWFLMLDEAHTFITEDFRDEILTPFDYFWEFKNKCVISATPYHFTDPRMAELDYHEVVINGKLGEITLVNAVSVSATVDHVIKKIDEFPANVHIAINSVTEIVKVITRLGVEDCNIYCADDEKKLNMAKLGELAGFHVDVPNEENFKKINFYTCKYFEGWDMYDENATLILVTDVHHEHTRVGVATKGIQFFGRLRGKKGTDEPQKPYQLIHITNSHYNKTMKAHEAIIKDCEYASAILIEQYNTNILNANFKEFRESKEITRFATTCKHTKLATLNHNLLDQQINKLSTTEIYNNIKFIKEAWDKKFDCTTQRSELKSQSLTAMKRKSKQQQFKEDYESLLAFKETSGYIKPLWSMDGSIGKEIKERNPLVAIAIEVLTPTMVEDLKYNPKKVEQEVILKLNEDANLKLLKLLDKHFKCGRFYTNDTIKSTLQTLYTRLGIKNKNGSIKVAYPADLGKDGRFEVKEHKQQDAKGNWVHGYKVLRKQFELSVAA